jgi:hypothetical protein
LGNVAPAGAGEINHFRDQPVDSGNRKALPTSRRS